DEDRIVSTVARGERPGEPLPAELSPDAQEVLVGSALGGRLDLVVDLVGPSFVAHAGGGPGRFSTTRRGWETPRSFAGCSSAARTPPRAPAPTSTRRSPGRCSARSTGGSRDATTCGSPSCCSKPAPSSSRA